MAKQSYLTRNLQQLWHGEYSLARSFWIYLVLMHFIGPFILGLIYLPFFLLFDWLKTPDLRYPIMGILALAWTAYLVIAMVGVWQSANKSTRFYVEAGIKNPIAPALTKFIVLIFAAYYIYTIGSRAHVVMQLLTA